MHCVSRLLSKPNRPALLALANGHPNAINSAYHEPRSNADNQALNRKLEEMYIDQEENAIKLRTIQSGYHQVITVAAELVQTLAACINGEKVFYDNLDFAILSSRNCEKAFVTAKSPCAKPSQKYRVTSNLTKNCATCTSKKGTD